MRFLPRSEKWLVRLSALAVALTALASEAVVIQKKMRFYGGGKHNNAYALTSAAAYLGFTAESLLYDLFFYGTLLAVLTLILRLRKSWNPLQRQAFVLPLAMALVVISVAVKWEVLTYFSFMFDLRMLLAMTEGNLAHMFEWISVSGCLLLLSPVLLLVPLIWALVRWARSRGRDMASWTPTRRSLALAGLAWALLAGNHFLMRPFFIARFGLQHKSSYWSIHKLFCELSDFDRDGYGPFTDPPDPDNFNAAIYPYAVDVPGNGIDEDGLCGDLEAVDPAAQREGIRPVRRTNGKNVMLIVVETFRTDAVEMSLDGRPVAPFLATLRRDQAYTPYGYSNYGVTSRAIQSLHFGSLHYAPGDRSLIDEFKAHGYRIYGVSAQNERWGNTRELVGLSRADAYFDTWDRDWSHADLSPLDKLNKQNNEGPTLDAAEVNERALGMIDSARGRPFFMYIDYQELHFPYYAPGMDKVFIKEGHPHTDTAFFAPGNRANILRQYCNGVHYLDRRIGELFAGLKARGLLDSTVIVIMGDHPDSFYENGVLGHAWTVDENQRRTPLFVCNGRGRYAAPIGQDEVAPIILNSVDADQRLPRAAFTLDPGRRLFMVGGLLETPRHLAWISKDDLLTYDFALSRVQMSPGRPWRRPDQLAPTEYAQFKALVNRWESEHYLRSRAKK